MKVSSSTFGKLVAAIALLLVLLKYFGVAGTIEWLLAATLALGVLAALFYGTIWAGLRSGRGWNH